MDDLGIEKKELNTFVKWIIFKNWKGTEQNEIVKHFVDACIGMKYFFGKLCFLKKKVGLEHILRN
jgi:hypothetical protein